MGRPVNEDGCVVILGNFSSSRIENIKHYIGNPLVEVLTEDLKNFEVVYRILNGSCKHY